MLELLNAYASSLVIESVRYNECFLKSTLAYAHFPTTVTCLPSNIEGTTMSWFTLAFKYL